jgi:hypothetical protein
MEELGNALFQIAATVGYSKKYNVPFYFPKWPFQSLINVSQDYFIDKHLIKPSTTFKETSYTYSEIPFKNQCSLSGYFQSWKYFEHCSSYIRQIFSPPTIPELKEYCCIHIRRGDYLNYPNHHPTQPLQYYYSAMEKVPAKKFMVFSDDINWCRQNFKGNEFVINDSASVDIDFGRMCSCSHFIIANSSFSWWSAWLGNNSEKVVVAPNNWFGSALKTTHPITDLIPPEWILL